jgi:hypothetical protein
MRLVVLVGFTPLCVTKTTIIRHPYALCRVKIACQAIFWGVCTNRNKLLEPLWIEKRLLLKKLCEIFLPKFPVAGAIRGA